MYTFYVCRYAIWWLWRKKLPGTSNREWFDTFLGFSVYELTNNMANIYSFLWSVGTSCTAWNWKWSVLHVLHVTPKSEREKKVVYTLVKHGTHNFILKIGIRLLRKFYENKGLYVCISIIFSHHTPESESNISANSKPNSTKQISVKTRI